MRGRSKGFSLLEVLVAFAILALSLGALMNIFSGGLRNLGHGRDYTQAALEAQSRLARLGIIDPLVPGTRNGTLPSGDRWQTDITPVSTLPTGHFTLYRIRLQVSWGQEPHPRSLTLDTLRIGPATS